MEEDFSGNETETETIHEVPLTRNLTVMPPYVSMADNSYTVVDTEKDEVENLEKIATVEENPKEDVMRSLEIGEVNVTKTGEKEIGLGIVEKKNKENGSFSNYIPHHLFGKEPVHT